VVQVDPVRPPGILTSRRAERVLKFLEQCGGASTGAVQLVSRDAEAALKALRVTGYARRCFLPGQEPLYVPVGFESPSVETYLARLALGWCAARAVETGLPVARGHVKLPNGEVYRILPYPTSSLPDGLVLVVSLNGRVPAGRRLCCRLVDLRIRSFRECLFYSG